MEIQGLKEQFIPKDKYIIIKEPFFSLYQTTNSLPSITVSSPNDVIFNADEIFDIIVPQEKDAAV